MNNQKIAQELVMLARDLTAGSENIVARGISKAISALDYLPTEYGFPDKKQGAQMNKRVKAVIGELEEILVALPVPVTYVVYEGRDSIKTTDVNKLIAFMSKHGHRQTGFSRNRGIKKWIQNQPTFDDMAGPVSDGPNVARYDTWEAFDRLTR